QGGPHSLFFNWSARGDASPEGLRFDLRVPGSAVAALELDLPTDRILSVSPDGCSILGPYAADAPDRRRWRIGFAGKSQLNLTVRRVDDSVSAALIQVRQTTRQELTPDGVQAEFRFELQGGQQEVRELEVEYDPTLRPYEVLAPGLVGWEFQPGDAHSIRVR